ncbi:hypothetical protein MAR_020477 [Mya arenaria]|uniref:Uncharacterized protein n=1 Tax=Mya arenaria TaxID=6604 RepID=A0ABY7E8L9_MYAAR|nr:hypothetical protein MAR_020477 [Mya arenaria]
MYWLPLLTNASHKIIVEQIEKLRQSGKKRVLRKYKHEFQDFFEQSHDSGDESDDERPHAQVRRALLSNTERNQCLYFDHQTETVPLLYSLRHLQLSSRIARHRR